MTIEAAKHLFSVFDVTRQVFFQSRLSLGIVNLKPLLPGHILILPKRVVPRLADLNPAEVSDLFLSVQKVGKVVEKVYGGQALTVSLQDGAIAGQSVPHVHVHIIPRRSTDFNGNNDEIYPAIEENEAHLNEDLEVSTSTITRNGNPDDEKETSGWKIPKDEDRKPRSGEEMEEEAKWLAGFFKDS